MKKHTTTLAVFLTLAISVPLSFSAWGPNFSKDSGSPEKSSSPAFYSPVNERALSPTYEQLEPERHTPPPETEMFERAFAELFNLPPNPSYDDLLRADDSLNQVLASFLAAVTKTKKELHEQMEKFPTFVGQNSVDASNEATPNRQRSEDFETTV
ncbi:MAG: hypothetical protein WCG05_00380 [Alphaproteobacteria bacterium]